MAGPLAALVLDGALDGVTFEWSVKQLLCPTLRLGQVVIMDNLSSHHRASVRTLIEAQGCDVLFASPYSPDFNPIELMFSKLKALVRGDAWRSVASLINAVGTELEAITRLEIEHWFKHAHPKVLL